MKFGKQGVFIFADMLAAGALAELARRIESLGYSTLWYPEARGYETFAIGGFLLGHTKTLIVASGIANIYARDPLTSAMGHNSLNDLYGGRFVLGLGVSHKPLVAALRGHEYRQPLETMRKYLDDMESAWTATNSQPARKQVVLAALGPKMSKLAAERTSGAFPYNITPAQAAMSRRVMGAGSAIICEQKVCLTTDPSLARKVARAALAPYMVLPNYYQNWFRLGFTETDLKDGGSDRLMDAMVYWGDKSQIKTKLNAYYEQGADQVVVQALRTDGAAGPDWVALET
ncbi:MAG: TIGR03620 family F420-dependent LLM class oxidoreductase, partial [Gammaproteobacteria bacterium]